MPSYDYECPTCGLFTEFRPIADRDVPAPCGICDYPAARVISAPNLALMNPISRMAAGRNERSRHEPMLSTRSSCCSGGPCSHKKKKEKIGRDGKPVARGSKKKNRRPWMLGH